MPLDDERVEALRASVRPLDDAEAALVRSVVSSAAWLSEPDEGALRYALNLARLRTVRAPDGGDVDLGPALATFRADVRARLVPPLLARGGPDRARVAALAPELGAAARAARVRAVAASAGRLSPAALDREVCEKALVLVCGGGGGVAWSYLGAFALLDRYGLVPRLLAGTSMGAVLLLFRARRLRWHQEDVDAALRRLTFRSLFRALQPESRYGVPAPLRLYLRAAIGDFLKGPDGHPLTLGQLAIPLVVAVTGIRNGAIPQLAPVYLGADPETRAFDAIDAVGFSSALPGVIHYDVLRDDERMHRLLGALLDRHDVARLCDGGILDNLPARAAWAAVQDGAIGTRNAFVLALEGFAPKLSQPLWLGLERIAAQNVSRSRPYAHHHRSFRQVLSPAEIVPDPEALRRAVQGGTAELHPDMAYLARMVRPFAAPVDGVPAGAPARRAASA